MAGVHHWAQPQAKPGNGLLDETGDKTNHRTGDGNRDGPVENADDALSPAGFAT